MDAPPPAPSHVVCSASVVNFDTTDLAQVDRTLTSFIGFKCSRQPFQDLVTNFCWHTCWSNKLFNFITCLSMQQHADRSLAMAMLSVRLSICPPVCLSACLSVRLSVRLSVCLPVCLSACLSVCLSACLSVCLSACLSVCLSHYDIVSKHLQVSLNFFVTCRFLT